MKILVLRLIKTQDKDFLYSISNLIQTMSQIKDVKVILFQYG